MAHTENGSIIEFSSDNLLTEVLIAIKYTRYFTSSIVLTLAIYEACSETIETITILSNRLNSILIKVHMH